MPLKNLLVFIFVASLAMVSQSAKGQDRLSPIFQEFKQHFIQELGETKPCEISSDDSFRICSEALRNEGNAPYILHHGKTTEKVVILFHGLTDSPFFYYSIAPEFHKQGYNVVVSLLPGHGKNKADRDFEDPKLKQRWVEHVAQMLEITAPLGEKVFLGGFSTGGALIVNQSIRSPTTVDGLLLFSGAMELGAAPEHLYGIKGTEELAKAIDGKFKTDGPNPYKYPRITAFGGLALLDVIHDIRKELDQGKRLKLPIFAAHSAADTTCMLSGIEYLLARNEGQNKAFFINKAQGVCHADLVVNQAHVDAMNFDNSQVLLATECAIPKANPQHQAMLATALAFVAAQ